MDVHITLTAALIALVGGYLLGSIPFGVIITQLGGAGDVRAIGSGNIGATNVLRTGRKDLAFLTLLGDGGKGAVAVLLARFLLGEDAAALAGGAAFVGHIFPVWLRFKGGKGGRNLLRRDAGRGLAGGRLGWGDMDRRSRHFALVVPGGADSGGLGADLRRSYCTSPRRSCSWPFSWPS